MANDKPPGALRDREFLKFWIGETVSLVGSEVTRFTIPLVAILTLSATAFEVGVLNAVRYVPIIVISLFAGVWLDRRRRRPILIGVNIGRAILIGLVPLAASAGLLSMNLLYTVAFLVGALTVIFDVGSMSYVPTLVERNQLADANGRLQTSFSLALIGGPTLAGLLIGVLTAPPTLTVNAISLLFSVVMILWIRKREPAPEVHADRPSVAASIAEGLRAVWGSQILRNLLTQSATFNLFQNAMMTVFVLFAVRGIGLSPAQLGLVLGSGAVGALIGSIVSNRLTRAVGLGRILRVTTFAACMVPLVFLFARDNSLPSLLILVAAHAIYGINLVVYNVNTLTLRQVVTPNRLLGRMNASYRMLLFGTIPVGALLGGTLAQYTALRTAMAVTALLLLSPIAWTFFSPVFHLKAMPAGPDDKSADEPAAGTPAPEEAGEPVASAAQADSVKPAPQS